LQTRLGYAARQHIRKTGIFFTRYQSSNGQAPGLLNTDKGRSGDPLVPLGEKPEIKRILKRQKPQGLR
jgi:hypothetical protein